MTSPFANGTSNTSSPSTTQHHGFPLPPEGRNYRPTYSGGRYQLPDPSTGKVDRYTRVTTGAHALDDTSGLEQWKMRNVVRGLHDDPDLLEGIDLYDDPQQVNYQLSRIADQAQAVAGGKRAAELGTAIHAWTEAVERDGMTIDQVPDQFKPYIQAYLDMLADYGISTVPGMVERIVKHDATGWVGTLDRIYQLADGTRVIGDVKTSKSLKFGLLGFSVQLFIYATADHMLSLDGSSWEPMPAVGDAFGVIAHVPSDRPGVCTPETIDLSLGRHAVEVAQAVREVRSAAGTQVAGVWALPRPEQSLADLVKMCTTVDQLSALWLNNQDAWTDELTQLGYSALSSHQQ